MKTQFISENEKQFFEKMILKEIYEYPVSTFDVIMSEEDNDDGLYIVKCYDSEYVIGKNDGNVAERLSFVPQSLKEALDIDLYPLIGVHKNLLHWLRARDYKGVNYDFEWEE